MSHIGHGILYQINLGEGGKLLNRTRYRPLTYGTSIITLLIP